MKREIFKLQLLNFGYKKNTIDKLLQGRIKPTLQKALILEQRFNIPCSAWLDIKSFISTSKINTNVKKQSEQELIKDKSSA